MPVHGALTQLCASHGSERLPGAALWRAVGGRASGKSVLARTLVLPLLLSVSQSGCADVEPVPATSESDPFAASQPADPTRRMAQVKVVLLTQRGPQQVQEPSGPLAAAELLQPSQATPSADAPANAAVATDQAAQPLPAAQESASASASATASSPNLDNPAQLEVSGDFAAFRGVDEPLVWAVAGQSTPQWSTLAPGDCMGVAAASRVGAEEEMAPLASDAAQRHIELLDLGRFQVRLGAHSFEVPLHLAPGVLPYASGVQYRGQTQLQRLEDEDELTLAWDGLESIGVDPARLDAQLLPQLDAELFAAESEPSSSPINHFDLVWSPLPQALGLSSDLFLHAQLSHAPTQGEDAGQSKVVCRLSDNGQWRLDIQELLGLGLGDQGESAPYLQLELQRVHHLEHRAGGFENIRLRVERNERLSLNWLN